MKMITARRMCDGMPLSPLVVVFPAKGFRRPSLPDYLILASCAKGITAKHGNSAARVLAYPERRARSEHKRPADKPRAVLLLIGVQAQLL
jgi:hypothetical protein